MFLWSNVWFTPWDKAKYCSIRCFVCVSKKSFISPFFYSSLSFFCLLSPSLPLRSLFAVDAIIILFSFCWNDTNRKRIHSPTRKTSLFSKKRRIYPSYPRRKCLVQFSISLHLFVFEFQIIARYTMWNMIRKILIRHSTVVLHIARYKLYLLTKI